MGLNDMDWRESLDYLYHDLHRTRRAYGRAEHRPGVTEDELRALRRKIEIIEWTAALVLRDGGIGGAARS
ncbi:MAG: hypothetical protein IKK34_07025 [Clostridia bacterium]|nr:hypothetical protein [Clostridia bacterium]